MKRLLVILAISIAMLAAGCGQSAQGDALVQSTTAQAATAAPVAKQFKVALVMKTLTNPFFVEMEKGARKAETELGLQLIVKTGAKETSIEQQIQIVEDMILQKVDAIVIAPGSSTELVSVLKKAQDSGIVIINIDNKLDEAVSAKEGLKNVPFVSVKNDEGAALSVEFICAKAGNKGSAIILEGIRDAENARLRKEGAESAFSKHPDIKVVASESANWKIDEAYEQAEKIFLKNPEVTLAFCANDMMALGLLQYLKEAGRTDVLVAGFDNLDDARTAIGEGRMQSTIDQQAALQGYKGVEMAVSVLNGKPVDLLTYVPVRLVTAQTLSN
jgi:ribose transport system substrate-binding protein